MVESIFGGKVAYPLGCHGRNVLHPRLADRRLSVPSTHLKTISETSDDGVTSTFASSVDEDAAHDGPTFYRRPRTMSLPAIYRDGSYLRIKRSSNTLSPCKRRYSEPGGNTRQQIIHRLSLRSSDSNESETGSCKRSSVKSMETRSLARESNLPDFTGPRRHSDPMCYITENMDRLGISQAGRREAGRPTITTRKLVTCPTAIQALSVSMIKPRQPQGDSQTAVVRRRKSSLVPVPFKTVQQQQQQKSSHSQPSSRPMSFPPSKKDIKRQCSLPDLKTTFLTGHVSTGDNTTDCNNNREEQLVNEEQALESDESKEDKYSANADILVQWMKFFG